MRGRRAHEVVAQAGDDQRHHQGPPRIRDRKAGYLDAAEDRCLQRGRAEQQGHEVRDPYPAGQDRLRRGGRGVVVAQGGARQEPAPICSGGS